MKVTVNLPEEDVAELKRIAKKNGRTVTETLRQALADQRFFENVRAKNSKILIKDSDDSMQEIIFR